MPIKDVDEHFSTLLNISRYSIFAAQRFMMPAHT